MGGPGGSPAYAFHMKGGGQNIVPVSQMVQKGAGPLIAAQNTSQVISATDQQQQQQQLAQNQPNISPPPPANLPPAAPTGPQVAQGQPPAAPGIMRDIQGNPLSAYTNVPSRGGLPPGQLAAQTASAGQPANPVANPVANATAPAVPDPTTPVPQVSQADADANIFNKVYSPAELAKMDEDPVVSNFAGFTWKQDRTYGNVYAVQRSPTNIFRENRYNWGQGGWQDSPTDKSANQQELHDIVSSTPGINYTDPQIARMSGPQLMAAINEGKRFKATSSDAFGQTEMGLTGQSEMSKITQRVIDQVKAAQAAGMDPNEFNEQVRSGSTQAKVRNGLLPPAGQQLQANLPPQVAFELGVGKDFPTDAGQAWNMLQAEAHGMMAAGHQVNPFVDNLSQEMQNLDKIGAGTPGILVRSHDQPGSPFNLNGVQLPISGKVSDINELAQVFQGAPYDTMLRGLNTFKKRIDDGYANSYDSAKNAGYRVSNNQIAAREAIKNNQPIADDTNLFQGGTIPKDMPPLSKTTTTVTNPTGSHVYQDPTEPGFFRATKPSAPVALDDEQGVRSFMKTKPSGTWFSYGGKNYMVP